jgi:streptomycin 6-kinase
VALPIPPVLARNCRKSQERQEWLSALPEAVRAAETRWSLTIGVPFETATASWVAPVSLADGTAAVLKFGMPHLEGRDELAGLKFWNGSAMVRLLQADEESGAMLLERCSPGTPLSTLPEVEQDKIIAGLLPKLWLVAQPGVFLPLAELMAHWCAETIQSQARWPDKGLVREGLRLLQELPRTASVEALLATDLHAGNVLRSVREPWLAIDPKPFVGDPAYDATQHLINCEARLSSNPRETVNRFADLLHMDRERVRLWTFARASAEPRDVWNEEWMQIARRLAP